MAQGVAGVVDPTGSCMVLVLSEGRLLQSAGFIVLSRRSREGEVTKMGRAAAGRWKQRKHEREFQVTLGHASIP